MGEVDSSFFQAPEHRPKLCPTEAQGIPLIDLSLHHHNFSDLVSEIGEACRNWGFFQVINHGVSLERRVKLELAAKNFFAQPVEKKREVKKDGVSPLGYHDAELTKNVRDWREVLDLTVEDPMIIPASPDSGDEELMEIVNQWPEYPHDIRETCEEYTKEMVKLSHKILELISLGLGLKPSRLSGFFKTQTSYMRLSHYPPCPIPDMALGLGRHKDGGAIAILTQDDVGGLEVKRKSDGEWVRVKPIPDAYIVNVGDVIQVWSNDKYESVEHRVVVNSERERFSIPFFFNPAHHTWVEPLEELIDEKNPPKYRRYSWGKFFATRKQGNFKKLNVENIQIHNFKISHDSG